MNLKDARKSLFVWTISTILTLSIFQAVRVGKTSPDTRVYIDPSTNMANPSEYFTVNVTVDVTGLSSWEVKLSWDADLLYTDYGMISEGDFLSNVGMTYFVVDLEPEPPAPSFMAMIGCMLLEPVTASGIGTLATVEFLVKDMGECTLDLYDTSLLDIDLNQIPHVAEDGEFYTTLPVASFTYVPDSYGRPIVGEDITFDASTSYDPDQSHKGQTGTGIIRYEWDFDDGKNVTETDPVTTHAYDAAGKYTVTLNVTDDENDNCVISLDVTVKFHDIAVLSVEAPTEVFVGGVASIDITVLNNGSDAEAFNVTAYYNSNPIGTNTTVGTPSNANVTFTFAWNTTGIAVGSYAIWANAYLVDPTPAPLYPFRPGEEEDTTNNARFGNPLAVTEASVHDIAVTSITVSPIDVAVDGWSSVEVKIANEGNRDETIDVIVYANSIMIPDGNQSEVRLFAGTSRTLTFPWYEGTNTTIEGDYNLTVKVPPVVNETDTVDNMKNVTVTMRLLPVAYFTFSPSEPLTGETVTFDGSASYSPGVPPGNIITYSWKFGDGASDTGPTVTHTYDSAGTYSASLTVSDNDGLNSTKTASVKIGKFTSTITASVSPTPVTVGSQITISGSISPVRAGANVTINMTRTGEETWTTIATTLTNETSQYSCVWTPSEVETYTVKAFWSGDDTTLPAEISIIVDVIIRDISVTNVMTSEIMIRAGESVSINATVINRGTEMETFNLSVYHGDILIETKTVTDLAPDASETISFSWTTQGVEAGTYRIKAVAEHLSGETYIADNTRTTGLVVEETPPPNVFLYTTVGLAVVIAAMAVYFLRVKKPRPT